MKMIYPELIKNRFFPLCFLMLFTGAAAASGIAFGCTRLEKNMDSVEKGMTYVTLCQIFLLFLVPMGIMLLSMRFASWEENCGGWRIIMTSGISTGSVHFAKILIVFVSVLTMLLPLVICGAIFLGDFKEGTVIEAVVLPLAAAYVCFLPMCVAMYFLSVILNSTLAVIFSGLLLIISTIFVSSSAFEKYDPLCYPYIISMNYDMVIQRIGTSIVVSVLIFAVGSFISQRRIAASI